MLLRTDISPTEMEKLLDLYEASFPVEERRPRQQMPPPDPAFRFYAVGEVGLLTAWDFGGYNYIEHFAIAPEHRGHGVGAQALAALSGAIILEVEPPEDGELAQRRIEFYRRNGFQLLDYDYIQPPYTPDGTPLPLKLMVRGKLPVSIDTAVATIKHRVYNQIFPK